MLSLSPHQQNEQVLSIKELQINGRKKIRKQHIYFFSKVTRRHSIARARTNLSLN